MAEEQQPAVAPEAEEDEEETVDDKPAVKQPEHPFRARIPAPEFPKDMEWMNTKGPLELKELKGKYVLLDFWTYCCINCIHILPELKKLEHEFPNQLVVVGVHSAKFDTEKEAKNISEAILRYEIEHPVVNDDEMKIWNSFSVSSWPTMYLIDPEGNVVYLRRGEFKADDIREVLNRSMPYYRNNGSLDETPIQFDLLAYSQQPTQLRFPGKVLADEKSNRLFISDSNHNRIVVTSLDGQVQDVIGSGEIGSADGGYETVQFDHPQGMALVQDTLYVADTENHLIRKVDLKEKQVTTIAGVGEQARNNWPGVGENATISSLPDRFVGLPKTTPINSPWALWPQGDDLYIAMAGPHQIWKMTLDEKEIGPYAGNGREDIVDGPLLPPVPYQQGHSSFAQPSGLASDGKELFVADSEGSSIRAVPFDPEGSVRTVIGTAHLPYGRLFSFGDVDGPSKTAKLQHALGVCYVDGVIYTADTYNNKIKAVDAATGDVKTIAGTGEPGIANDPAQFDEPAGLSHAGGKLYIADTNNHMIRVMDLETKEISTLEIKGLKPMPVKKRPEAPEGAIQKQGSDMAHSYSLYDFRKQLEKIARPSLLQRMLGLMPGIGEMTELLQSGEHHREMRRLGGMIDSMTPAERSDPQSIDHSRRQRIANGAGVSLQEVNELLKQFASMASLMEAMAEGGTRSAIDKMRELRRGEIVDNWQEDDDILGDNDLP